MAMYNLYVMGLNPSGHDGYVCEASAEDVEKFLPDIRRIRDECRDTLHELNRHTYIGDANGYRYKDIETSDVIEEYGDENDTLYEERVNRCNDCHHFVDKQMQFCPHIGKECSKFISIDDYFEEHKEEIEKEDEAEYYKILADRCVAWIQDYFKTTKGEKAVIGISGGKDSTVVAYLCVKALGKENVIGVLMPNGNQTDINDSYEVVNNLGIKYVKHNIAEAYNSFWHIDAIEPSAQAKINLAPRLRMTTLYFIAQSVGGRVVGTGNLCERMLGYYTLWGDGACDMNPIGHMLVSEVIGVGRALGIAERLLVKPPSDGLTGKTDEDSLGFTYAEVEKALNGESTPNADKINSRVAAQKFKRDMTSIPMFKDDYLDSF